mmetsp:Transcript_62196/g.115434  ORF Transcript_62196/g.115434 Transcript_62196/m.115434 type:complete len:453 (-) Transcript_62196:57-1415(-)
MPDPETAAEGSVDASDAGLNGVAPPVNGAADRKALSLPLTGSAPEESQQSGSQEVWNLFMLSFNFSVYFAFRSGCLIVLPLTCKSLLADALDGATMSPLFQLPMALWFCMDILVATPNARFQQAYGRRAGLCLGGVGALIGCGVAFVTLRFIEDGVTAFVMLNIAVVLQSVVGMSEFVKYAAAEACSNPASKSKVVSRVIGGGAILSAFGPFSSTIAAGLDPDRPVHSYAWFFVLLGGFVCLSTAAVSTLKLPPVAAGGEIAAPPLLSILARTEVWTAILAQVTVQFTMVTPMSATPLAMENRLGLSPKSYLVSACIVSHVVSMFFPGFFTGNIIRCLGSLKVILIGLFLQAGCPLLFIIFGFNEVNFFAALVMLGVGWNLAFVAGTLLLLDSHSPLERTKVTSCNETLRFMANGIGAIISSSIPFDVLSYICLAGLGFTALLVIGLMIRNR